MRHTVLVLTDARTDGRPAGRPENIRLSLLTKELTNTIPNPNTDLNLT